MLGRKDPSSMTSMEITQVFEGSLIRAIRSDKPTVEEELIA
jgi:hypothetical protein